MLQTQRVCEPMRGSRLSSFLPVSRLVNPILAKSIGVQVSVFKEFFDQCKRPRPCKKSAKYGGEVTRLNQNARQKLQRMFDVTKIPKRSLASYAMFLLYEEFEKWLDGRETKFGYDVEVHPRKEKDIGGLGKHEQNQI